MNRRAEFQNILETILGAKNVYFQPPANIIMQYPAIVYELNKVSLDKADDLNYKKNICYMVTLIHKNPDNDVFDKLLDLTYSKFNRHYVSNNLHHYVFEIYY